MAAEKKKLNVVGGLTDLLLFVMLVGGAGFGGYFIGINQKLAPVQMVPPGTVEAIEYIAERAAGLRGGGGAPGQTSSPDQSLSPGTAVPLSPLPTNPSSLPIEKSEPVEKSKVEESKTDVSATDRPAAETLSAATKSAESKKQDQPAKQDKKAAKAAKTATAAGAAVKKKYWVASSGSEYIGSSVTVVLNGQPVDNFFGPGKLIDVSRFVKKGPNRITFDSKVLDDEYNQHLGNSKFDLTLKLVSGTNVREDHDANSVLVSFKRTAADLEDSSNTLDFTAKE